jgi:hypothetical protein
MPRENGTIGSAHDSSIPMLPVAIQEPVAAVAVCGEHALRVAPQSFCGLDRRARNIRRHGRVW